MTVQTNTNVASFNGNGVTQIFPIAFKFNNDTDLVVLLIDDATGAATQLTLNSNYTVSGEGDEEGGLINVVVAPAVGQRLKVTRIVDILQLMDLRNQGKFFPEVHEDAFDLLTMIAQQHESSLKLAIRAAESDPEPSPLPPAANRANQLMGFDANGNPVAVAPVSGSASELAVELSNSADPSKGASKVGLNGASLRGFYGEKVSIESFGAVPGGDIADACDAALAALAGTDKVLLLPNTVYQISRTIRLDGLNVYSDGCEIRKNFNGVGIEIQGGSDYFDLEGTLYLRGTGAGFYDPTLPGAVAPANPNAHGFWFNSARIRIRGKLICQYHQGDLFRFTCAGNMNKTNIDMLWGWWGGRGVYFEGTQDDFSVCEINLRMQFTWGSGVATSADFMGRGWRGYWYSEGCSIDGVSPGMDIKKLRNSLLDVYCEQQNAAQEFVLGAACTDNTIRSQRRNKDQDLSGNAGRNLWAAGTRLYNPGFAGDARNARAALYRSDRARPTSAGEYVDIGLELGSTFAGSVRAEGGTTSPYVGIYSANGTSRVAIANDDFVVAVNGVQQLRSRTTGVTLGVGNFSTTGASSGKEVDSTTTSLKSSRDSTAARDHLEFYNPNGKVGGISTSATATTYATSSDRRLKENIEDAGSASVVIDAIQVVQYDWLADGSHEDWGVVAQQVAEVYPRAVTETDQFMVDYSKFVPLLIKEVQELRARVASLEAPVE